MKEIMMSSLVLSGLAIVLLIYLLMKTKNCKCNNDNKEGLLLCDNMGNAIYKDVDYSPYVYNYPNTEFGY